MILSRACWTLSPEVARASPPDRFQLVDFIDEDNAALGDGEVAIGAVEQAVQDGLDFFADKLGLGQRSGIGGDKGHIKDAGQRFAEQGFAGAGRADQQDVAFGHFDGVDRNRGHFAVVRINRHGQRALRLFLADDVFVKLANNVAGFEEGGHQSVLSKQNALMLVPFRGAGKGA
jgi:hypothetical protein